MLKRYNRVSMEARVVEQISRINRQFYQEFAGSFSATRQRIQPGAARLLARAPRQNHWLDIGCGNGNLAAAWLELGCTGRFLGCDWSESLLRDARVKVSARKLPDGTQVEFQRRDVAAMDWTDGLPSGAWDRLSTFAVLHHIPSRKRREQFCQKMHALLCPQGEAYLSVWQLFNSPRLRERIQPWEMTGLTEADVEAGDVLMDWRAGSGDGQPAAGLRYVHVFSEEELTDLARISGFVVAESFFSDGKIGNLALYQTWEKRN